MIDLVIATSAICLDRGMATYGDGRSAAGDGDLLGVVDGGVGGGRGHDGSGHDGDGGVLELHLDGRFVYKNGLVESECWFEETKASIDSLKNGRPKSKKPVWILGSKFVVGEEERKERRRWRSRMGGI